MNAACDFESRFPGLRHIRLEDGPGGLAQIVIRSPLCSGRLLLQGAQALSFMPEGGRDVLWTSPRAVFEPGKPVRGGVPVCWPWFGAHPSGGQLPFHGFARTQPWELEDAAEAEDGSAAVTLRLTDTAATRALWPGRFELRLTARFGAELNLALEAANTGAEAWGFTSALHSYFHISHIRNVSVRGLEGFSGLDTTPGGGPVTQSGPVRFERETDLILHGAAGRIEIDDPGFRRVIRLAPRGSGSTVVWNPWEEKAARLGGLGPPGRTFHHEFVCVETANIGPARVELAPGGRFETGVTIRAVPC